MPTPSTPAGGLQAGPAAFDGASGSEIGAAGGGGGPGADFISTAEITLLSAPAFLSTVRASAEVSYLPGDASTVVTIRSSDSPAFNSLMTAALFNSSCAKSNEEIASNARAGSLLRMQVLLAIRLLDFRGWWLKTVRRLDLPCAIRGWREAEESLDPGCWSVAKL